MIEPATLHCDLVGQHTKEWGVEDLGKRLIRSPRDFLPTEGECTMAKHMHDEVAYYYDSHPTEDDLMGQTTWHSRLVYYLMEVLTQLFRGQQCAIYKNLNFYQT